MFIKAKIVLVLGKKPFFFFTVWGIGGEYEKAESENVEGWASWNLCKKKNGQEWLSGRQAHCAKAFVAKIEVLDKELLKSKKIFQG